MLTFEQMAAMTQPALKRALAGELRRMGYRPESREGFLYARGEAPVMLVAHMDTVHDEPAATICRSGCGRYVASPQGIGGDDRAGCHMALEIAKRARCHLLFCEDEETGARGARAFAASGIEPAVNYIVGLDRRGENDAVFYGCDNPEFAEFVTGFGFEEASGSFSDISVIAPALGIAAVNISAGFYSEHTLREYVDMEAVANNIRRAAEMAAAPTGRFGYVERARAFEGFGWAGFVRAHFGGRRAGTKELMPLEEGHWVTLDGGGAAEGGPDFFIDSAGRLYEHDWELGAAVEVGGAALTESGLPARFDADRAVEMETMDAGDAWEATGLLRGGRGWPD